MTRILSEEHSGKGRCCRDISVSFQWRCCEVEFFGDEIDRISEIDSLTGEVRCNLDHVAIFPNSHYVVEKEKMEKAIENIKKELAERIEYFKRRISFLRRRE